MKKIEEAIDFWSGPNEENDAVFQSVSASLSHSAGVAFSILLDVCRAAPSGEWFVWLDAIRFGDADEAVLFQDSLVELAGFGLVRIGKRSGAVYVHVPVRPVVNRPELRSKASAALAVLRRRGVSVGFSVDASMH